MSDPPDDSVRNQKTHEWQGRWTHAGGALLPAAQFELHRLIFPKQITQKRQGTAKSLMKPNCGSRLSNSALLTKMFLLQEMWWSFLVYVKSNTWKMSLTQTWKLFYVFFDKYSSERLWLPKQVYELVSEWHKVILDRWNLNLLFATFYIRGWWPSCSCPWRRFLHFFVVFLRILFWVRMNENQIFKWSNMFLVLLLFLVEAQFVWVRRSLCDLNLCIKNSKEKETLVEVLAVDIDTKSESAPWTFFSFWPTCHPTFPKQSSSRTPLPSSNHPKTYCGVLFWEEALPYFHICQKNTVFCNMRGDHKSANHCPDWSMATCQHGNSDDLCLGFLQHHCWSRL